MRVAEVMIRDVETVSLAGAIQKAASAMDSLNVGALPVCDGERLQGGGGDLPAIPSPGTRA